MEKRAADAERASVKYKQAEYLSDKIGQTFDANISGVSKWGLYAEIEGNKCEGMIPIGSLRGDYYMLDEDNYQVIGRRYGKCYKLGDSIRIRVKGVDMLKKLIDFDLVEEDTFDDLAAPQPHHGGSRRSSRKESPSEKKASRSSRAKANDKAPKAKSTKAKNAKAKASKGKSKAKPKAK